MHKTLPWFLLIGLGTVLFSISFCKPVLLSDDNKFLKEFVNHEFLSTLGFILAVTLASAASLHIELNKLEDATKVPFPNARRGIGRSAYSLIILFLFSVILVIVKPLLPEDQSAAAISNSIAVLVLYFNISVLFDLTRTVFNIPSAEAIKAARGANGPAATPPSTSTEAAR